MRTCKITHTIVSLYFITNIVLYAYVDVDKISIVTEVMLFFILQYTYGMMQINPPTVHHTFQKCSYCQKLTPQQYIHCKQCGVCVDVLKTHNDMVGFCVSKAAFRKYIYIVRGMTFLNIILCILLSVKYPWTAFTIVLHLYVLKSTYLHGRGLYM